MVVVEIIEQDCPLFSIDSCSIRWVGAPLPLSILGHFDFSF